MPSNDMLDVVYAGVRRKNEKTGEEEFVPAWDGFGKKIEVIRRPYFHGKELRWGVVTSLPSGIAHKAIRDHLWMDEQEMRKNLRDPDPEKRKYAERVLPERINIVFLASDPQVADLVEATKLTVRESELARARKIVEEEDRRLAELKKRASAAAGR